MKILTALITHNRLELLKRCVNSIENQSFKDHEILVINNSSTDGTEEYLKSKNINTITQSNSGSASGWSRCFEYAIKFNFDFIWLMDDDGYPDEQSLEKLISRITKIKDLICVSSVVLDESSLDKLVFPLPILDKSGLPKIFSFKRKYYYLSELINEGFFCYPYAQLFNGSLISLKNFKSLGNINKNYYIYGEEVDFFWRMKKLGLVETLLDSYHFHPDVSKRKYTDLKIYYFIKNTIINNYKYFSFVSIRNLLTLVIILLRVYSRNGFLYSLDLLIGGRKRLIYKALIRGLNKKLSIDHDK